MSLSEPKLQNPCSKFIKFKGIDGTFRYWDKELKRDVIIQMPVKFIVLDELSTVSGFNDHFQCGIYSNEVHSLKNQTLNVRSFKGGISIVGRYDQIKGQLAEIGGKYTKSVYAALITKDGLELVNFQLSGIANKAWIDKQVDTRKAGIQVKSLGDGKKGAVKYKIPVYEELMIEPDMLRDAISMDKKLQEYIKAYKEKNRFEAEESEGDSDEVVQPDSAAGSNQEGPEDDTVPF